MSLPVTSRDRHGRGPRGPLLPPQAPGYRTRRERFDAQVQAAAAKLPPQGAAYLSQAELRVVDIPFSLDLSANRLGVVLPAGAHRLAQLVLFRKPIQLLAGDREFQAEVIYRTLVELIAELSARTPQSIDPHWGD